MQYRIEHDSMGEVQVPADRYWGAQANHVLRPEKMTAEKLGFLTAERFDEVFHPEQMI